jgi:Uma2 family endonuclease
MVELTLRRRVVELPFSVRVSGVTERLYDELVDEDTKADLVDGVMTVRSPATLRQDEVAGFLRTLMLLYANERRLGAVCGPHSVVQPAEGRRLMPDVFFVEAGRMPRPTPPSFDGTPDAVLDVHALSALRHDFRYKVVAYQEAAVREIWVVDLEAETVEVSRRLGRQYRSTTRHRGPVRSRVMAGFWLDAAWLWADPLPSEFRCLRQILEGRP